MRISRIRTLWLAIPEPLRHGIAGWLFGRVTYTMLGLALVSQHLIPNSPPGISVDNIYFGVQPVRDGWQGIVLGIWQRWDAIHYLRIAENGYTSSSLSAFFPLYPFLGRYISSLTGLDILPVLLLISDIAVIGIITVSFILVQELYSVQDARQYMPLIMTYPWAFFLFAPYADGLGLFYILLAAWSAKHSKWGWVGVCGLSAGLTRPSVLPLVVILGYAALQEIRYPSSLRKKIGIGLATVSPIIGMGIFEIGRLCLKLESYTTVLANWEHPVRSPLEGIFGIFSIGSHPFWGIVGWITFGIFVVQLLALFYGRKSLPFIYTLYTASNMLFLLTVDKPNFPLGDWGRHSLLFFPIFIYASWWFAHNRRFWLWWAIISWALQLYLCGLFFMWFPI